MKDYTLEEAKKFLSEDFIKVLKRTRYLYVETKPDNDIGYGFFEPILLCLSWCDFLGALYSGIGNRKELGNTERSKIFINEILGVTNPKYNEVSENLVKIYRNGTVHAYTPTKEFDIRLKDNDQHLKKDKEIVTLSIEQLLIDMIAGTDYFAEKLYLDSQALTRGSLVAFNKARQELG